MNNKILIITLILFSITLFFAFTLPLHHDYVIYTWIWSSFLSSGHPYLTNYGEFNGNAYGIVFTLFAYLYKLNPVLPRAIFVAVWFVIGILLMNFRDSKNNKPSVVHYWALIFLNPYLYIFLMFYGNNEIISVLAIFLSMVLMIREKEHIYEILAGIILALGFLFKITPIFLFPFLCLSKNKIRSHFLLSFIATVMVGFGTGYYLFGREIWIPFTYVLNRTPTFLSIFYFLQYNPLSFFGTYDLSYLSFPAILLVLSITFFFQWKYHFDTLTISIIVLLEVLLFSKVNLPQYYMDLLILLLLFLSREKKLQKDTFFRHSILGYFYYISAIPLVYYFFDEFKDIWNILRSSIGLPTFIFTLTILILFVQRTFRNLGLSKNSTKV